MKCKCYVNVDDFQVVTTGSNCEVIVYEYHTIDANVILTCETLVFECFDTVIYSTVWNFADANILSFMVSDIM